MKKTNKANLVPLLYLLPTLILLGFWLLKPLIETAGLIFTSWNMLPGTSPTFIGLDNFERLFNNPNFKTAMINTVYYISFMIPFSVIIPLLIASATQNMAKRPKRILQYFIVMPIIIPPVVSGVVYRWMFHPTNGIINTLLTDFEILDRGIRFLSHPDYARTLIAIITGLRMIGYCTLIYLAGMSGINKRYYEAAELDGASKVRQFFDLTLPLLSPTIIFVFMLSILFANQWSFTFIDVLTEGGPFGTTTNIFYMMYQYAFQQADVGISATASIFFLVLFGFIAYILTKLRSKLAFYDN